MSKLSHLDENGAARMVDVSDKAVTDREAVAEGSVTLSDSALAAVGAGTVPKGDVFAAARISGIMAAKRTSDLIPLCHPVALTGAKIEFEFLDRAIRIRATIKTSGQTGVEMEALTAVSVAALTIYDMIKAIDKSAIIGGVHLVSKSGGKSGAYVSAGTVEPRASVPARAAGSRTRARSSTLIDVAEPLPARQSADVDRRAFRTFMQSRRLRASVWANEAGVASSQLYAYLTGRLHALPADAVEKLARVARVRPEDMFR